MGPMGKGFGSGALASRSAPHSDGQQNRNLKNMSRPCACHNSLAFTGLGSCLLRSFMVVSQVLEARHLTIHFSQSLTP